MTLVGVNYSLLLKTNLVGLDPDTIVFPKVFFIFRYVVHIFSCGVSNMPYTTIFPVGSDVQRFNISRFPLFWNCRGNIVHDQGSFLQTLCAKFGGLFKTERKEFQSRTCFPRLTPPLFFSRPSVYTSSTFFQVSRFRWYLSSRSYYSCTTNHALVLALVRRHKKRPLGSLLAQSV